MVNLKCVIKDENVFIICMSCRPLIPDNGHFLGHYRLYIPSEKGMSIKSSYTGATLQCWYCHGSPSLLFYAHKVNVV